LDIEQDPPLESHQNRPKTPALGIGDQDADRRRRAPSGKQGLKGMDKTVLPRQEGPPAFLQNNGLQSRFEGLQGRKPGATDRKKYKQEHLYQRDEAQRRLAFSEAKTTNDVIPAKAGIQKHQLVTNRWTPAFAGVTTFYEAGSVHSTFSKSEAGRGRLIFT
ncbi:MAG: hypothetical protein IH628_07335, partial [Proteobacteria bacterium]|nr:hypothetical protein [Pseudomonadota bacterium]